ncbi:hypothetical protein RYH80_06645 [Halobaculum sp. MBLA0147]|uniref:hypothetical protein n=1 Tax=Halobaculum sp. MBLA0147 TaxID=3079934 RepID=UPI0035241B6A
MRRRSVLATLGATFAGGCLRLTGGGDETATRTRTRGATDTTTPSPTASPTESPTDSPTPAEPPMPSGLTENGVRPFLYSVHQSTLNAASFEAEWSKLRREDSSLKWQRRYRVGSTSAVGRAQVRAEGGPVDVYRSLDTGTVWREPVGSGYTYGRDDTEPKLSEAAWASEVEPLIRAGSWSEPTRANDSRPAVWEVTTDTVSEPNVAPGKGYGSGTIRSLSGTMRIDQRGFVRSLVANYELDARGETQRYTSRFAVSGLGSTTVSEPSWVQTALDRRPRVAVDSTDDDRFVTLTIEEGNRLEPGTVVSVYSTVDEFSYDVKIDRAIEPGTTTYLSQIRGAESSPTLQADREERPIGEPPTFDGTLIVEARRAALKYFRVDGIR